ncbi:excalibur calcium-binding domain-containing protein [Sphingomonas sp. R647]|uniref:excalibur calcium-binding domain-containing protein n=1 Tax=Sphingomonas sp. R647 TaxID=2875233 RepID=UPI001CD4DE86|nr:excalibur calcium-binding domain-containing protein [Sphingomonas sp. R647]MCA1199157.1 excalibur calcium-binding domain-containing protein [Sphingomonas sp. R647]
MRREAFPEPIRRSFAEETEEAAPPARAAAPVALAVPIPVERPKVVVTQPTTRPRRAADPAPRAGARRAQRSSGASYYANCSAVRAAGAAPIRRGQSGYSRKLDRDGDGVACE